MKKTPMASSSGATATAAPVNYRPTDTQLRERENKVTGDLQRSINASVTFKSANSVGDVLTKAFDKFKAGMKPSEPPTSAER